MTFDETTSRPDRKPVDLDSTEILDLLGRAPAYGVYVTVRYAPTQKSQTIVTSLQDGIFRSDVRLTDRGEKLIINDLGEHWVISNADFWRLFYPREPHVAIGFTGWVRAFENPKGEPVESVVNGKMITGGAGCWFVVPVEGDQLERIVGEPYFVEAADFAGAYMPEAEAAHYFSRLFTTRERVKEWFRTRFAAVQNRLERPIDNR